MEVDAGQLRDVIKHFLKVGCAVQYVWVPANSTVRAEGGFQRTECPVIAGAGEAGLHCQFGEEFRDGSLQVTSPAALLQNGDPFGRKIGRDDSDLLSNNIFKPT